MDFWFRVGNAVVMPAWLVWMIAPGSRASRWLVRYPVTLIIPFSIYAVIVLPITLQVMPLLVNPQLSELQVLTITDRGFTAIWMHLLVLDQACAWWLMKQYGKQPWNGLLVRVNLFMTLLLGPLGFVISYFTIMFNQRSIAKD